MARADIIAESKYRSRTLWLVVTMTATATVLVWFGKIDGSGWTTFVGALFIGWQVRRFKDNQLRNGKDD